MAAQGTYGRSEHAELINGLTTLYATLVRMDHLDATDMLSPEDPDRDANHIADVSITPKAVALIRQLPFIKNEVLERWDEIDVGIPLAPHSRAISYYPEEPADPYDWHMIRDGQAELSEDQLKLTRADGSTGYDYVYNMATKILEVYPKESDEEVSRLMMSDWVSNFQNLEWIPWKDDNGMSIEQRSTQYDEGEANPRRLCSEYGLQHQAWQQMGAAIASTSVNQLIEQHKLRTRTERNKFWAKRRIFEDAGWPNDFDRNEFVQRRA